MAYGRACHFYVAQYEHSFLGKPSGSGSGQAVPVHCSHRKINKQTRMLQFNRWFWSPNDWKPQQVLFLVCLLPTNEMLSLLQYSLQMNMQLASWTKGLWHLLLRKHWLKWQQNSAACQSSRFYSWAEHSFSSLFSCLICQHYLSLPTRTSKSFWCLPNGWKQVVMTSVSHSLILLVSERGCTKGEKPHRFWEKWLWGPLNKLLYSWRRWHALFTTRTDTFPLFCFYLAEGSTSRWFSRDLIKLAYITKSLKWFTDSPFGEDK